MESLVLDVPAMYADHHVVAVRHILFGAPGVHEVDASSAFGTVDIQFDPNQISADALRRLLDEAGYLTEVDLPVESGEPAVAAPAFLRHSTVHELAGASFAFEQEVVGAGRPRRPSPRVGPSGEGDTPAEDGHRRSGL